MAKRGRPKGSLKQGSKTISELASAMKGDSRVLQNGSSAQSKSVGNKEKTGIGEAARTLASTRVRKGNSEPTENDDGEAERNRKGKSIMIDIELASKADQNQSENIEDFPPLPGKEGAPSMSSKGNEAKKTYVSLFNENRNVNTAEKLQFYPEMSKGKLKLSTEDAVLAGSDWNATLIGVVTGLGMALPVMRKFVDDNWQQYCARVHQKDNGVYIFQFRSEEGRDWVMKNGPWAIDGSRPLTLKVWEIGMEIGWESFEKIPVWTCLPNLDPSLCNSYMLGKVGSAIGRPICMDKYTATGARLSYARVLIEVTAEEAQRRSLEIEHANGRVVNQRINYEWLPRSCSSCKKYGHTKEMCQTVPFVKPQRSQWVWVPKKVQPASEKEMQKMNDDELGKQGLTEDTGGKEQDSTPSDGRAKQMNGEGKDKEAGNRENKSDTAKRVDARDGKEGQSVEKVSTDALDPTGPSSLQRGAND